MSWGRHVWFDKSFKEGNEEDGCDDRSKDRGEPHKPYAGIWVQSEKRLEECVQEIKDKSVINIQLTRMHLKKDISDN